MEPTVFTDVEDHMFIADEESFGPVMIISKFQDGWVLVRRFDIQGIYKEWWLSSIKVCAQRTFVCRLQMYIHMVKQF